MNEREIKHMSVNETIETIETIETMEALWNSFISEDAPIESPEWHGDILASRKEKIEVGKANFISLDKLKQYYSAKN